LGPGPTKPIFIWWYLWDKKYFDEVVGYPKGKWLGIYILKSQCKKLIKTDMLNKRKSNMLQAPPSLPYK
jgi:hypothetical protein